MMISLSENFMFIFLLALNPTCIFFSTTLLIYGAYYFATTPSVVWSNLESIQSDGTVAIIGGCLGISVGVAGIAFAFLKQKLLFIIFASVLGVAVVANICICISIGVAGSSAASTIGSNLKIVVEQNYGFVEDAKKKKDTEQIDEFQTKNTCCGWTGTNDENIYLKTEWYRVNFVNNQGKNLPDSCCITANDDCWNAKSMKYAKEARLSHELDCSDVVINRARFLYWVSVTHLIILSVCQLTGLAVTVLSILTNTWQQ